MYIEYMDGFSRNESLQDGQYVTSRRLQGIWKILPKDPQSIFYPWIENPTGRELGGMRIEQVEPKKRFLKRRHVSRASLVRIDSMS